MRLITSASSAIRVGLAALALLTAVSRSVMAEATPPAVILQDPALPAANSVLVPLLTRLLAQSGYAPRPETVANLMEPGGLMAARCALLVLPQARELPAPLAAPVTAYLRAGGHLLALGVPAWQTALVRGSDGRWERPDAQAKALALTPPPHPVFDFPPNADLADWMHNSDPAADGTRTEVVTEIASGHTAQALHVIVPNSPHWDNYGRISSELPFPQGRTLTVFSAKGGPATHRLAVEWDERDGSRWIAVVPLTARWRRYVLPPSEFKSWLNSPERAAQGFHPENATHFSVGLAESHTGPLLGAQEYWTSGIGTADTSEAQPTTDTSSLPILDTLSPDYGFFPVHGSVRLTAVTQPIPAPASLLSMQPRPSGIGYAKKRGFRWVPLLRAADARSGEWRGVPATLLLHAPGPEFGGAWAAFTPTEAAFYQRLEVQRVLGTVLRRMRDGLFLGEGGAEFYTLFPGQPVRLGAQVMDIGPSAVVRSGTVRLRVTASNGQTAFVASWVVQAKPGQRVSRESRWTPRTWPAGGYIVTTELLESGRVVDRLSHALNVWTPPAHPDWVTIHPDGHFYLNGHLWRVNGVNYMPSSGIAQPNGLLYERWLSAPAYDPEVIERDLTHIEKLGLNAISVFLYRDDLHAQNLMDLLRRCRAHQLRVNMSLRPGVSNQLQEHDLAEAEARSWDTFQSIITGDRLAQNDTIFAYEIDWEPDFARYGRQKRTDGAWAAWVGAHYGSVATAEQAWGVPAPRDAAGNLTGPSGAPLQAAGGPETKMVAAYRRFLDDWLADAYGAPAHRIRALAPHQAVSFRMTGASDPLWGDGGESYQFPGLARALDFLAPESYGQILHGDGGLGVQFRIAYGRSVAPHEPVLWAETGMSVWAGGDAPDLLRTEGDYYHTFYRLAMASGADGIVWWWYPGGFRIGENSDYGLINPDGTDRPATVAVRRDGPAFLRAPLPPAPDVWLDYDRDQHPDGVVGVFRELKGPFAAALAQGHRPGLRPRR